MKRGHLDQIEGLRGYLALWVALGHGLQLSGFLSLPGPLGVLLRGEAAVAIFMILSGFVITHLLLQGRETYSQYITRRFLRLFPAYALCCAIGYLILGPWAHIVQTVSWQDLPGWAEYSRGVAEIASQTHNNTAPHALLHLFMLHGLIPDELLPRAAMTFLPAAWSLSLEWQFYLVAPLILRAFGSPVKTVLCAVVFALLLVAYEKGFLGSYPIPATLAATSGYFAIGILSRLLYPELEKLNYSPVAIAAASAFLMLAFSSEFLPLSIWLVFYSFLVWGRTSPVAGSVFSFFFATRIPLFLGGLSYSLYLIHRPIQVILGDLALGVADLSRPQMVAIQIAAIIAAVPAAYLIHRFVELPGIALGKRLTRREQVKLA
ncbi:acyltransferase family protein [Hansschlegelia quercus]|uniref:Acyltransferase n=1 Tax=Hansschlegelia quercus TaxID=2528245 RepID=A0A4Q9GIH9_9HYPH|nr:acyltransferase [Hansschlegelia quercus]TBN54039.1 acyltransferase [Hansschlegelia quercus]